MKNYIIFALFILVSVQGIAQTDKYQAQVGYSIFKEVGMEFYNDKTFQMKFDWKKVIDAKLQDGHFAHGLQSSLTETFGDKIKFLETNFCIYSEILSEEEIGNTILKEGIRINDVGQVETMRRVSLATYNVTGLGIVISSRTENNVPLTYVYTADHNLSVIEELDGYEILDYHPSTKTFVVGKVKIQENKMTTGKYTYDVLTRKIK